MQFSDPNTDNYGGNPYGYGGGTFGRARRPANRRNRGCMSCLTTILVLALLGALLGFLFNISVTWGGTTIQVAAAPTLIIKNETYNSSVVNTSNVRIHAGQSNNQIHISPVFFLNIPFGLQELYRISDDRRTVIYDIGSSLPGTMDISVPAQTNLIVYTNSTSFEIEGITGRMLLSANNGELVVKNCHLTTASLISNNTGMITLTSTQLSGTVTLENNTADIEFQGSLEPNGEYSFANNSGKIKLTLPQNSALHIDATILSKGTINSNIPQVKAQPLNSGFDLHTDVGATPRASLSLYDNNGSITLNEQGGL